MKNGIHVLPLAARVGPSQGHEYAIKYSKGEASKKGHGHVILLGSKANPLPAEEKKKIFQRTFRGHRVEIMHPNIVDHVGRLAAKHKEVHVYASDDEEAPGKASRHEEYARMFKHLPNVHVHPIARVKDTSGNEFRGRHMRQAAEAGDFQSYKKMFAKSAGGATVRDAYRKVRQHLSGTITEDKDDKRRRQHQTFLNTTLGPVKQHLQNLSEPKVRPDGGHESIATMRDGSKHRIITTGGKGYVIPHNEILLTPQKGFMGMNKRVFHEEEQLDEVGDTPKGRETLRNYRDKVIDQSYVTDNMPRRRYRGLGLYNRRIDRIERKRDRENELKEGEHWIQGAIKHPGALHRELGVPEGEKIPSDTLRAAAKKGGKLGQRARLAVTLKKMHEDSNLKEARKSSTGSDASEDPNHIIMDLRKAAKNHMNGNPVKWENGTVSKVHPTHIEHALRIHDELKKAGHPRHIVQNYIKRLGKSQDDFYEAMADFHDYLREKAGKK
jgi:hypothetical protein